MKGYGTILKNLRGDKSIDQVAQDLGISRSAITMYETEARVPRDEIKVRIAEYFDTSVQDIFFTAESLNS